MLAEGPHVAFDILCTIDAVAEELVLRCADDLRAGMGLSGGTSIADFQEKATFVEISGSGLRESHAHDVMITKEAPNYRAD